MRSHSHGSLIRSFAAAFAVLLSGCSTAQRSLDLPPAASVTDLVVSDSAYRATISDPDVIRQVMALLSTRNEGYRVPIDTFPTPEYTILIRDSAGDRMVIWVGPDWLGGRELRPTARDKRLRSLDPTDRGQLLHLLTLEAKVGVPPNYCVQLTAGRLATACPCPALARRS